MSHDPASYLEGIPIKINKKCYQHYNITVPSICELNVDLLTKEYDFACEKTILDWIERKKGEQQAKLAARRQKLELERKASEEEERTVNENLKAQTLSHYMRSCSVNDTTTTTTTTTNASLELDSNSSLSCQSKENSSSTSCGNASLKISDPTCHEMTNNEENCEELSPTDSPHCKHSSESTNQHVSVHSDTNRHSLSSKYSSSMHDMLSPLPHRQSRNAKNDTHSLINFAEFEGEASDPFDSAALKSINDLEELAKVLQPANINPHMQLYSNRHCNSTQSFTGAPEFWQVSKGGPEVNAVNKPHRIPEFVYPFGAQMWNSDYHPYSYSGQKLEVSESDVHMVPGPQVLHSNIDNINSNSVPGSAVDILSTQPQPVSSSFSSSNFAHSSLVSRVQPVSSSCGALKSSILKEGYSIMRHCDKDDLEKFYSKYYTYGQGKVTRGSREMLPECVSSSFQHIRPSQSVPDLSLVDEKDKDDMKCVRTTRRTVSRPSSTELTGLEDWQELKASSASNVSSNNSCESASKRRLPDPFLELDSDAQAVVESLSEMGFPRPRVARAVQKLGTQHKKLVEVLLILQSLQDEGEDEYKSERAFYHYFGDVEQTKELLNVSQQFSDLGFDDEKIVDSLLKHNNDRDKAFEELLSCT